jgi:hypothetical protein
MHLHKQWFHRVVKLCLCISTYLAKVLFTPPHLLLPVATIIIVTHLLGLLFNLLLPCATFSRPIGPAKTTSTSTLRISQGNAETTSSCLLDGIISASPTRLTHTS